MRGGVHEMSGTDHRKTASTDHMAQQAAKQAVARRQGRIQVCDTLRVTFELLVQVGVGVALAGVAYYCYRREMAKEEELARFYRELDEK